jgi:hypothetical protein
MVKASRKSVGRGFPTQIRILDPQRFPAKTTLSLFRSISKKQTLCKYNLAYNVLRLCEEADFGAQNCQHITKVDAM